MTEKREPDQTPSLPPYRNNHDAPFIQWDGVAAFGVMNGAIQIELVSRILIPNPDGEGATAECICSGRLRCSPAAAASLREGIDQALKLLQQPLPQQAVATGKLN